MIETDPTPTRVYLDHLFADCGAVELRHQAGKRWTAGLFDDPAKLLATARSLARTGNLFTTLNPLKLRLAPNRMGTAPIRNDDVLRYSRLFFDFDPVRPTDCPSTHGELLSAKRAAHDALRTFHAMGFPPPAEALSGNGWHLVYRVALPNDPEVRELLTAVYSGLRKDFMTDVADFDISVRNPGRIGPLYGSVKRKGTATLTRPHRQSKIWLPREWRQVSRKSLEGLAQFYLEREQRAKAIIHRTPRSAVNGAGDYHTLDVVAWFAAHGHYHRPAGGMKHFVRCPWEDQHSDGIDAQVTDTVVWEAADGWPTFHCSHSHCDGRTLRDVMEVWGDADAFCTREWRAAR